MKRIRILETVAAVLTVVSFAFLVSGFFASASGKHDPSIEMSPYFRCWIESVLIAILSMLFYGLAAIRNFYRAILLRKWSFYTFCGMIYLAGIPLCLFVGGAADFVCGVIWNVYYLGMLMCALLTIKERDSQYIPQTRVESSQPHWEDNLQNHPSFPPKNRL